MFVSRLSVKLLRNLGNYQNETIEAEITLSYDDDPDLELSKLREWVSRKLFPEKYEEDF